MRIVILAAGRGKRLGLGIPKALTKIDTSGRTILDLQINSFSRIVNINNIIVVAGYKKELLYERYKNIHFTVNERYEETNTSKSLLSALDVAGVDDIVWINGDVVCNSHIIEEICRKSVGNHICVKSGKTAEEEIKYTLDSVGRIEKLSKTVKGGLGEAVGINRISKRDVLLFKKCLELCDDNDYFEKGVEIAVGEGVLFSPLDIGDNFCVEVDFPEDLVVATKFISKNPE